MLSMRLADPAGAPAMSLRRKTLLLVIASIALLLVASDVSIDAFVIRGLERRERERSERDTLAVAADARHLSAELRERLAHAACSGALAESAREVGATNAEARELCARIAQAHALDFAAIFGAAGELRGAVWGTDSAEELAPPEATPRVLPAELEQALAALHARASEPVGAAGFDGFLFLEGGAFELVSLPIACGDGTAPTRPARLLAGASLAGAWLERLQALAPGEVALESLRAPATRPEHAQARERLLAGAHCATVDDGSESLAGCTLLEDLRGGPGGLLCVRVPKLLSGASHASPLSVHLVLLGLGASIACALCFALRRAVVDPLQRLESALGQVESGQRARVEVASSDEIGRLAARFNAMAATLHAREHSLAEAHARLRRVLDHLEQVVLSFDRAGLVRGDVSRHAMQLFRRPDIQGRPIAELLFAGQPEDDPEREAFVEWLRVLAAEPPIDWKQLEPLAPRRLVLRAGQPLELHLELHFRPIHVDGRIEHVMLLASDVTAQLRRDRATSANEDSAQRQLRSLRQLVAGGGQRFVDFLGSAERRLAAIAEHLPGAARPCSPQELEACFRHAHTIKSEARLYELAEVERSCAELEDRLGELMRSLPSAASGAVVPPAASSRSARDPRAEEQAARVDRLTEQLVCVQEELTRARAQFVEASPIGAGALDQVALRRSRLALLDEAIARLAQRTHSREVDAVRRRFDELSARPFGEIAAGLRDRAPVWGAQLGKLLGVEIDGRETAIPSALLDALGGALAHLVRNCVAHGLEQPEERRAQGKPERGLIRVWAEDRIDALRVGVEDDGAGVDWAALEQRARARGLAFAAREELLFASGLSTAERVDALAGRGVGLDAVRRELSDLGARIEVSSEARLGTRFVFHFQKLAADRESLPGDPARAA